MMAALGLRFNQTHEILCRYDDHVFSQGIPFHEFDFLIGHSIGFYFFFTNDTFYQMSDILVKTFCGMSSHILDDLHSSLSLQGFLSFHFQCSRKSKITTFKSLILWFFDNFVNITNR